MTGFAAYIDFGKGRGVCSFVGIVILVQVCRVTLRALVVPYLINTRPVHGVTRFERLIWIQMEPALPALMLWTCIPGDSQHLKSATGKLDQVLLEWRDAEGVLDLVVTWPSIRPLGIDEKFRLALEETRGYAQVGEARLVEIAQHRPLIRFLHSQIVVGTLPRGVFPFVAKRAALTARVRGD